MDAQKIQVKLFASATDGKPFPLAAVVPTFHDWIRRNLLPELMIDVASYEHVPDGPGVLFVGHGSDYYLEEGKGRLGLLYSRKRQAPPPGERLRDAFRRAVHAAALLQDDPHIKPGLRFSTAELLVRINDRLLAPNDEATFANLRPELEAFFREAYDGAAFTLARTGEPRELFTVAFKLNDAGQAPDLAGLLQRLGGPPTVP